MNIGIVSLTAMPSWGGAEIYLDRLNRFLNENEHTSILYTATPEVEGYDNGGENYHRIVLPTPPPSHRGEWCKTRCIIYSLQRT